MRCFFLASSLAAVCLYGCGSSKVPSRVAPRSIPSAAAPIHHFAMKELVGQWNASVSYGPRLSDAARQKAAATVGKMNLKLVGDGSFKLSSPGGSYSGIWTTADQTLGQSVSMKMLMKGKVPMAKIKKQMIAKGAKPKDLANFDKEAVLALSPNGKELASPTQVGEVRVTFRKEPS